jgi:hypothetical protein|tara:strand:+ start:281 stop:472 length:192 start_codon:yes stop_codon:yes gene_type:complete
MNTIERGTWLHKGHKVKFTILEDETVMVKETFGASKGTPKRLDMYEAVEYQEQIKEIGYDKEN